MRDLIERKKAIEAMGKAQWAKERLMELPSAEPEIIHCRDCEWWEKQEKTLQGRCCLMQMYPTWAWFCGNAQKKVDADMREDQNDQNK